MNDFVAGLHRCLDNCLENRIKEVLGNSRQVILFGLSNLIGTAVDFIKGLRSDAEFILIDPDCRHVGSTCANLRIDSPEKIEKDRESYPDSLVLTTHASSGREAHKSIEISQKFVRDLRAAGFQHVFNFLSVIDVCHVVHNGLYRANAEKLGDIHAMLADETSRACFASVLEFRITSDPDCLQVSSYQAYDHPLARPEAGDTVFDCGAFDGDSARFFIERLGGDCLVYSFEPEEANYAKLLQSAAQPEMQGRCIPVKAALSDREGVCSLEGEGEGSRIGNASAGGVKMVSLDYFITAQKACPDLVKMDVEGNEFNALKGCWRYLSQRRPKLQICVYHKAEDLITIPQIIKRINPDYRLYFGHHNPLRFHDSVLYAV